jgi:hypothetical protein
LLFISNILPQRIKFPFYVIENLTGAIWFFAFSFALKLKSGLLNFLTPLSSAESPRPPTSKGVSI